MCMFCVFVFVFAFVCACSVCILYSTFHMLHSTQTQPSPRQCCASAQSFNRSTRRALLGIRSGLKTQCFSAIHLKKKHSRIIARILSFIYRSCKRTSTSSRQRSYQRCKCLAPFSRSSRSFSLFIIMCVCVCFASQFLFFFCIFNHRK